MDDFPKRLREAVDSGHFYAESSLYFDEKIAHTVDEAADRIERLTRERDEAVREKVLATQTAQRIAGERDEALALLRRARQYVEQDAQMMADITRHSPLDAEAQARHDSTEYESERLLTEIDALLARREG